SPATRSGIGACELVRNAGAPPLGCTTNRIADGSTCSPLLHGQRDERSADHRCAPARTQGHYRESHVLSGAMGSPRPLDMYDSPVFVGRISGIYRSVA